MRSCMDSNEYVQFEGQMRRSRIYFSQISVSVVRPHHGHEQVSESFSNSIIHVRCD